jgi:formiminotetrahydrofolate cyclodeaminase
MQFGEQRLDGFLDALASKSPTPGGGSVVPIIGALGAALGQMVVAYSVDRKSLAEHHAVLVDAKGRLERARSLLMALAEADAEAYGVLNEAMKRSKDDPHRAKLVANAARDAIAPPRASMALGIDLLRLLEELGPKSNPWLASDLRIAAILVECLVRCSAENVRINLGLLSDTNESAALEAECQRSCEEAMRRGELIRQSSTK